MITILTIISLPLIIMLVGIIKGIIFRKKIEAIKVGDVFLADYENEDPFKANLDSIEITGIKFNPKNERYFEYRKTQSYLGENGKWMFKDATINMKLSINAKDFNLINGNNRDLVDIYSRKLGNRNDQAEVTVEEAATIDEPVLDPVERGDNCE